MLQNRESYKLQANEHDILCNQHCVSKIHMEAFILFNGGDDGEHNSVGLAEISKLSVAQNTLFDEQALSDRIESTLDTRIWYTLIPCHFMKRELGAYLVYCRITV